MDSSAVSVAARATVAAAPADVYDLLGNLDRHREITDRGLRIVCLEGPVGSRTGGLVELHGPAGLRRLARTRVQGAEPNARFWGSAVTAEGSSAVLEWRVEPHGGLTHVEVRLDVKAHAWRDRALLVLGGRAWLRARLRGALERLAQVMSR